MVCNKKRKPVFIKRKWNHVVFSITTILSFHPVMPTNSPKKLVHPHTFINLPNNSSSNSIIKNLNELNVKIASLSFKTNRDLRHPSPQRTIVSDVGVYCIPCRNCNFKYIGETSRNFQARLKEHKKDIKVEIHFFNTFLNQIIISISILLRC